MKNRLLTTSIVVCSLFSSASYAFFCPKNFNLIEFGDTLAHVEQQCGAPDKKVIKDTPDNQPQEWSYFLQENSTGPGFKPDTKGTLKTSIAFDATGKSINISVNGVGVGSTNNCGQPVSVGDSRIAVEAACGKPTLITKQDQPAGIPTKPGDITDKQVDITYDSTPPVTLIFEGGKLTGKK